MCAKRNYCHIQSTVPSATHQGKQGSLDTVSPSVYVTLLISHVLFADQYWRNERHWMNLNIMVVAMTPKKPQP